MNEIFERFWRKHPALLYGTSFALGISFAFFSWKLLIFPIFLLFLPLFRKSPSVLRTRLLLGLSMLFMGFLYVYTTITLPCNEEPMKGKALFTVSYLKKTQKFSKTCWEYRGVIKEFIVDKSPIVIAKNTPVRITLNQKENRERPTADQDYLLHGSLIPSTGYYAHFKPSGKWKAIPSSFRLAELRFHFKEKVTAYLKKKIENKRVFEFLRGIATGEFDSEELKFEFARFGLQHIMAISGFHFAIVAGFFTFFLKLFIPRKVAAYTLIFLLSSYFLFLGPSPSIMRAWLMILIVILATLFERVPNGLNSLGIALFIILLIDPLMVQHIGFQFSMLITCCILLGYSVFDNLLKFFIQERPFDEVIKMPLLDQHGYCLLTLFRKVLALSITVNIVSIPLALFYFQKFPLLGLIYNWFFPFMVSISITLLILSMLTYWLPPLSGFIYSLNITYTSLMLDIVYNMPISFDTYLYLPDFQPLYLSLLLSFLFFLMILLKETPFTITSDKESFRYI